MVEMLSLLQNSIGPVIIISGVGLLILSMTNRFARIVDRIRLLAPTLENICEKKRPYVKAQLNILWKRSQILRVTIAFSTFTILITSFLIGLIFLSNIFMWEIPAIIAVLFVLSMLTLSISLILFAWEIEQALTAVKLELQACGIVIPG